MALGAIFAQPLLTLWVGRNADLPPDLLIWLMFTWNALVFIGQPFGYMLAGLSEVRRLTQYAVVSSLLGTLLMWLGVRSYGTPGVVAGMIVGFLPFLLRANIVEALQLLRRLPAEQYPPSELVDTAAVAGTRT
jgi:O-antigen/teichoic acid export membrane protein